MIYIIAEPLTTILAIGFLRESQAIFLHNIMLTINIGEMLYQAIVEAKQKRDIARQRKNRNCAYEGAVCV